MQEDSFKQTTETLDLTRKQRLTLDSQHEAIHDLDRESCFEMYTVLYAESTFA